MAAFDSRPIVDLQLERDVDKAGIIHQKKPFLKSTNVDHYGKGPKGYLRSDEKIRDDVNEALFSNHEIDASNIEVEVTRGLVILRGKVESRPIKRLTETVVDRISGVIDVRNELTF